jgi:hypothetical protein
LLELLFQLPFETRQEFTRRDWVLADHPVDDDLISIRQVSEFPEALIGLWEISQPLEPLQKPGLKLLELADWIGVPSL